MHEPRLAHSFRNTALAVGLAGAIVAAPMLAGCGADGADAVASVDSTSSAATSLSPDGMAGSAASDAADSSSLDARASNYDFSEYISDDGTWEGVDAEDYVTLGAYTGIQVVADVTDVSQAAQSQIDSITSSFATSSQVTDRAVEDGDTVNIDYVGKVDGQEFDGGSTDGQGTTVTIGVTQYIDDFLQQLVGHTPGETFDVNVTFPDDYSATDLAGKDATFTVTINFIVEQVQPEVTDQWVSDNLGGMYGWSTVQDMTDQITDQLRSQQVQAYLLTTIRDSSAFAARLPETMEEYQVDDMLAYYQQFATMYGSTIEDVLPMVAGVDSLDALLEVNRDAIETNIENFLVVQAIAQKEGITVSDGDVASYLQRTVGDQVDVDAYTQQYGTPYLRMVTMMDKVLQFVEDNSDIQLPQE